MWIPPGKRLAGSLVWGAAQVTSSAALFSQDGLRGPLGGDRLTAGAVGISRRVLNADTQAQSQERVVFGDSAGGVRESVLLASFPPPESTVATESLGNPNGQCLDTAGWKPAASPSGHAH